MSKEKTKKSGFHLHIQRFIFTGVITVIPIWITWIVFKFVFEQFSNLGMPGVRALARNLQNSYPNMAEWLLAPWFQSMLAFIVTIVALYLLGWLTSKVVGKRLLALFDFVMNRIPVVQTVYGAVKKLINVLEQKPEGLQRVVLINFPSPEMKTVGFVTRLLKDHKTGQELAAVYVPTTPNPTSGYLEIVPVAQLVSTDWTMDEAMSFVISGGAIAPEKVQYTE